MISDFLKGGGVTEVLEERVEELLIHTALEGDRERGTGRMSSRLGCFCFQANGSLLWCGVTGGR